MDELAVDIEKMVAAEPDVSEEIKLILNKRVKEYSQLISQMAMKYRRNRVEHADLVQEGMIGLILAVRGFKPQRSPDFHTYAIYRIKGKMYEYCIGNENPIYVPAHIAKAAAYVKQMQRLLEGELRGEAEMVLAEEIIVVEEHEGEGRLSPEGKAALKEIKRKMENIAKNSKMPYPKLAKLAYSSLSLIVPEEALAAAPLDAPDVDDAASDREMMKHLKDSIDEKRFTVLWMRALGWAYVEIADELYRRGYGNNKGLKMTRQAVKNIYDETIETIKRTRFFRGSF